MHAETIIRNLELVPHPEGGHYRQTYISHGQIPAAALPLAFVGPRHYSTAILFLLRHGEYSHLHRIRQDEVWHYHLGGPLRLVMISPEGEVSQVLLGPDLDAGQQVQWVVPAGYWFGAVALGEFTLVGCTVAPGFDFQDFELGRKAGLKAQFPQAAGLIEEFALENSGG